MKNERRSNMQYSLVKAAARTIRDLPRRGTETARTKAKLNDWEGEGGAVADPPAVAPTSQIPAEETAAEK